MSDSTSSRPSFVDYNVPRKPRAKWRHAIGITAACVLLTASFLGSERPLFEPIRLLFAALLAAGWIVELLETFVRRTLLTEEGVEYRDWFGRTRFFSFADLTIQKWEGDSIVLTDGSRKVKLRKVDLRFPQAPDLLRRKISRQLVPYPGW